MQTHKTATLVDEGEQFAFIEVEPDAWLCVKDLNVNHAAIHRLLDQEEADGQYNLRISTRWFKIRNQLLTFGSEIKEQL